ncbi:hypothetical protein TEA_009736 [Camellia sinensis var. sinensis]|uniref:Sugar phosphate transporter domain-containing protein n=1 Tax=Camellia sinensis var. sinensis TaxID=542762 RepID=A0A4S4DK04_CAMSN|nr:hypothetical protein TEA_009736 [Camellia sinensis var. sinensis]
MRLPMFENFVNLKIFKNLPKLSFQHPILTYRFISCSTPSLPCHGIPPRVRPRSTAPFPYPVFSTSNHYVPCHPSSPAHRHSVTLRGRPSSWSGHPLGHPLRSALLMVSASTRSPFAVGPPHGRSLPSVTLRGRTSSWSVPPLGHPSRSALLIVSPPRGRPLHSITRRCWPSSWSAPSPRRSLPTIILSIIPFVGLKLHLGMGATDMATTLTGFHFAVTALVGLVSNATGYSASKHVPLWELLWFSIVANMSITGMNLSLMLNSVGFYQSLEGKSAEQLKKEKKIVLGITLRGLSITPRISKLSMIPVVCVMEWILHNKHYSREVKMSVVVVVIGVGVCTVTDVKVNAKVILSTMLYEPDHAPSKAGIGLLLSDSAVLVA